MKTSKGKNKTVEIENANISNFIKIRGIQVFSPSINNLIYSLCNNVPKIKCFLTEATKN